MTELPQLLNVGTKVNDDDDDDNNNNNNNNLYFNVLTQQLKEPITKSAQVYKELKTHKDNI
jgi:hypothetical protein